MFITRNGKKVNMGSEDIKKFLYRGWGCLSYTLMGVGLYMEDIKYMWGFMFRGCGVGCVD